MRLFFSRALPTFLALRPSNMAAGAIVKPPLRGVVFDMDGTLTVPVIDFAAMYRQVLGDEEYRAIRAKNPVGVDILGIIDSWSPPRQREAYGVIAEFERQGLERLQIMPGATEVCQFLDTRQIRRGLITRNMKTAVDLFHQKIGLEFSPALSREFRPYKPDPAPLLHICSTWNIRPNEVIMVGDSLKDDVACGKRAGSFTCLLDETGRYSATDFSVSNLHPDFTSSIGERRGFKILKRPRLQVQVPDAAAWVGLNPGLGVTIPCGPRLPGLGGGMSQLRESYVSFWRRSLS